MWTAIAVLALLVVVGVAAVVAPQTFGLRAPGVAAPGPGGPASGPELAGR